MQRMWHYMNGSKEGTEMINALINYPTFCSVFDKGYRYGFNGMERDRDIANDDYDFGARIYDGRIGRWLSLDPLMGKYNYISPYSFCFNAPILCRDPNGMEVIIEYTEKDKKNKETTKNVKYDNGKYFSEKKNGKWKELKGKKLEAVKKNEFVSQVVGDIEKLRTLGGETENRLKTIEKSSNRHLIRQTSGANENYYDNDYTKQLHFKNQLLPTGSTILYNPSEKSSTGQDRPSFIGLGHELLGHGYLKDQGLHFEEMITTNTTQKWNDRGIKQKEISTAEINVISFENVMREAYNSKLILENNALPESERKNTEELAKTLLLPRNEHGGNLISEDNFKKASENQNELSKPK